MNIATTLRPSAVRRLLVLAGLPAAALLLGVLISIRPAAAIGVVVLAALFALAFLAPATHLTLLIFSTAILPYDLQNAYSVGGVTGAGLVLSDIFLLTGLLRALLLLVRTPSTSRMWGIGAAIVTLMLVAGGQAVHGYLSGAPLSLVGYELRTLLGWSTVLVTVPVLMDPVERRRLMQGLVAVGIALGLWGLLQYFARIPRIGGASYGVFEGVNYTEGAVSIQGGLFAFPIAFVMGVAALSAGAHMNARARLALRILVVLNGMSLLLTYERTFWIAALAGVGFVIIKARSTQRLKAVVALGAVALIVLPVLAAMAPGALQGVQQRFLSIGQYGSDNSVRTRIVETRAAVRKIEERPLLGSGLGDTITYGMPWLGVRPASTDFLHNGYVWLAWKLGIPATLLLVATIAWAVASRAPPGLGLLDGRVRQGAQAGLFLTLIVAMMFPAFRGLAITVTLGTLLALCLDRPVAGTTGARLAES